jgi:hypothetical protein
LSSTQHSTKIKLKWQKSEMWRGLTILNFFRFLLIDQSLWKSCMLAHNSSLVVNKMSRFMHLYRNSWNSNIIQWRIKAYNMSQEIKVNISATINRFFLQDFKIFIYTIELLNLYNVTNNLWSTETKIKFWFVSRAR